MSEFGRAFRAARAAGKSEFSWNGKSYNTKLREEAQPASPAPRQQAGAAAGSSRTSPASPGPAARPLTMTDARRSRWQDDPGLGGGKPQARNAMPKAKPVSDPLAAARRPNWRNDPSLTKPAPKNETPLRAQLASAAAAKASEKGKWVKKAKGGSVRGMGCATRGGRDGKMK